MEPQAHVRRQLEDRGYVLHEEIGRGGFGTVCRADDTTRHRRVAVKLLGPRFAGQREPTLRFLREARALQSLSWRGIVEILDVGALADGRPFLVMELLDGMDLERFLERSQLAAPREALSILEQVCSALAYAHARGIVHRDVKASNVFLDATGHQARIVLLDFGLAKLADDEAPELTQAGQSVGTPGSMAPEQIRGGRVDARTDVYGLGCLAFHMLTGRPPFPVDSPTQARYMHAHAARPRPSALANLDPALDEVVIRAMSLAPRDRQCSAMDFFAAFRTAVHAGRPGQAAEGPSARAAAPCRAFGVHVEMEVPTDSEINAAAIEAVEAAWLECTRTLVGLGYHRVLDTSVSALFVRPLSPAPAAEREERRRWLGEVVRLHHGLAPRLGAVLDARLRTRVHVGSALIAGNGVRGGDLLLVEDWRTERLTDGVFCSDDALARLDEPAPPGRLAEGSLAGAVAAASPRAPAPDPAQLAALAQIGRMTAGLVHELRGPLTCIQTNIEVVAERLRLRPDEHDALRDVLDAARQAAALATDILRIANAHREPHAPIPVRALVDRAVTLTRAEVGERARVVVHHRGNARVHGSQGRLLQVLVNLVVNAADAMPQPGRISIATAETDERVRITVADTGAGMAEDVQARIFDSFFTTKPPGKGTGLGLSLVKEIVAEHGGTIQVSSAPGAGSTFMIELPAAPEAS